MTTAHHPPAIDGLSNAVTDNLVGRLHGLLGPAARADVLVPFAGTGQLVRAVRRWFPQAWVDAVEPDTRHAEGLHDVFDGDPRTDVHTATLEDFLANRAGMTWTAVVLAEPPAPGTAWADHITAAWDVLRPGGHLVAIAPVALVRSGPKNVVDLFYRVQADPGARIYRSPDLTVRTVLVEVQGGGA